MGVLTGCSSPQKEYVFTQSVPAKTEVLQEILVSIPMDIKKQGDLLYVSDFNGDSLLSCYSISERHLVGKMLPQGQGAGEFLSPVEFFPADSTFFVHNRWHFTAQDYSFDLPALSIRPQGELMRLPMGADHLCPVSGSRWVVSGVFEEGRFMLLDGEGHPIATCGSFPDYQEGEEAVPNTAKAMFHQSQFGSHPSQKRLACVTSHVLELWDCDGGTLTLKRRGLLAPYHYRFEAGPDGVFAESDQADAVVGARGLTVSGSFIYVLYNPNTQQMHDERNETMNSEIWVFDWEGNPVRKLLPDVQVSCICVDETDTCLYAIVAAPDYCIGRIAIPD